MVRAILLGLVQGLTEFLPVSSSGHLVVVPYLFSWRTPGLTFTVALHAGTLFAAVAYFAADLWYLASRSVWSRGHPLEEVRQARRAVAILAVASVPAAVVGLLLQSLFERVFTQPLPVAGFFLVTAGLLYAAELVRRRRLRAPAPAGAGAGGFSARSRGAALGPSAATVEAPGAGVEAAEPWTEPAGPLLEAPAPLAPAPDPGAVPGLARATGTAVPAAVQVRPKAERDERSVNWTDALVIGCAQALALLPGVSRSGSTIAAGVMRGLSRDAAARFSFLLLIPAVAGATLLRLPHLASGDTGGFSLPDVAMGVAVSALSGYWAIGYLLRLVREEDLMVFQPASTAKLRCR